MTSWRPPSNASTKPQRVVGDLLTAEVNEKQALSIKYQLTIAKLPLAKDLADFKFAGTPINETLGEDLARWWLHRPAAQRRAGRRTDPDPMMLTSLMSLECEGLLIWILS